MENGKICPKCYGKECTKKGIVKNKQRYRCKRCKYNFTRSTCWKYSDEIRQKALKLYLEGNGFRRIERLIHVSQWVTEVLKVSKNFVKTFRILMLNFMLQIDFWHMILSHQINILSENPHTFTVERMNRLLRHYLARFARKTYCWSHSLSMIPFSVSLFAFFY